MTGRFSQSPLCGFSKFRFPACSLQEMLLWNLLWLHLYEPSKVYLLFFVVVNCYQLEFTYHYNTHKVWMQAIKLFPLFPPCGLSCPCPSCGNKTNRLCKMCIALIFQFFQP